jgi:DMSO/TMAO reductase YedYZ molybdopterin-dependent catalytic subunit
LFKQDSLDLGETFMWNRHAQIAMTSGIDRRDFLLASAAVLPLTCGPFGLDRALAGKARDGSSVELIRRQKDPDNLESPFSDLSSFITPNELFYIRNHFSQPRLDQKTWRLKVEGAVKKELELTLDDLRKLPRRTETVTLECAGNNRAYLVPKARGVPWELGAVSNARWTGVPLAAVLERAGVTDDAVEVILEGADKGELDPGPRGAIHFARSLPLAKAKKPEVLLAYEMNSAELPPAHGFPLRAVVAGWFGVASVKWLQRLVVSRRPFGGFFQTMDYSYFQVSRGLAKVVPLTEIQVKAQIARPKAGEVVAAAAAYRVHGAAWTGESEVTRVEISTDGGGSWHRAKLLDRSIRHAWRLWEYTWNTPQKPGPVKLVARATDARGNVQPLRRDPDRRNYMISHVLPVEVQVK